MPQGRASAMGYPQAASSPPAAGTAPAPPARTSLWAKLMQADSELERCGPRLLNALQPPHSIFSMQKMLASKGSKKCGDVTFNCNHILGFGTKMGGIFIKAFQKLAERGDVLTDPETLQGLAESMTNTTKPRPVEIARALVDSGLVGERMMLKWDDEIVQLMKHADEYMRQTKGGLSRYEHTDIVTLAGFNMPSTQLNFPTLLLGTVDLLTWGQLNLPRYLVTKKDCFKDAKEAGAEEAAGVDKHAANPPRWGDASSMRAAYPKECTDDIDERLAAELEKRFVGSASIGAVYDWPIFPFRGDPTDSEGRVVKLTIQSRWAAMQADFCMVDALLDPSGLGYFAADELKGDTKKLMQVIRALRDGVEEEFNLLGEMDSTILAQNMLEKNVKKNGQEFLRTWAPQARAFWEQFLHSWIDKHKDHMLLKTMKGKLVNDVLPMLLDGLTGEPAKIAVPKVYPEECEKRVLTMSKCGGKTMKAVLQSVVSVGTDPEKVQIGQVLSALYSGISLHMMIEFIGWMLLVDPADGDKYDVIHADPHPGNFMYELQADVKSEKTDLDMSNTECMQNFVDVLEGNGDNMIDFLYQMKLQVKSNTLHCLDWGSVITDETLKKEPCGKGGINSLKGLRAALRKIFSGLHHGRDAMFKAGVADLGLQEDFAEFVRVLLCGAQDSYAERVGTSSAEDIQKKFKELATSVEDSDISCELAKLANILLFAGGLWHRVSETMGDFLPANKKTLANVWAHWLPVD